MTCSNCQADIPQDAKFCPECGHQVGQAACPECGAALKPGARFCHNCGAAIADAQEATPAAGARPVAAQGSRLATLGPFLLIPFFALIVVLLFWQNREPQPLNPTGGAQQGGAPDMAAMNQVHETLQRLKKNLEANPNDLVSMDSLAVMYAIAGKYDEAIKYYERHLEIEPDNTEIKIALGLSYHNIRQSDKGIALIQEVLTKEPTNAFALFYLGELYAATGHKSQAEQHWQKVVDTYPNTEIARMASQRIHDLTHTDAEGSN